MPFSLLYLLGHFLNLWRRTPKKVDSPIICIGNLVAGGAGKTPVAIAIGKILQELKVDLAYLSAGYGGRISEFTLVDNQKHNAGDVGDEPLLLSEIAPTFISKDRLLGAGKIAAIPSKKSGKKIIVMDDGLQNQTLAKDFSIMVIDGNYGFGNGFVIPAGPLREPIRFGIKRADLIIIVGEDKFRIAENFCGKKEVLRATIKPTNGEKFNKKSVIAFCGIGRPEKFFESLKQNETSVIAEFSYPDHYQYKSSEIEKMLGLAQEEQVKLITTKKDWVRLMPLYQEQIDYLEIEIEFENKLGLVNEIKKYLGGEKQKSNDPN